MAIIKSGGSISDIRGSVAGITYQPCRTAQVIKRKGGRANARPPALLLRASYARIAQAAWRALSQDQQDAWLQFSDGLSSGYHLFLKSSLNRMTVGLDPLLFPALYIAPELGYPVSTVFDVSLSRLRVLISRRFSSSYYLLFYATPMISAGIGFFNNRLSYLKSFPFTVLQTLDFYNEWHQKYGALQVGQRIGVMYRYLHIASGLTSEPMLVSDVIRP